MSKYGMRDVFDLKVYGKDGLLFEINTMKSMEICKNFESGEGQIVIYDALIDMELLNDILKGKYNNQNLRINGTSTMRGLDCIDKDVKLRITIARINKYEVFMDCFEPSVVKLVFDFPIKDAYGFQNAVLEV